MKNIIRFSSSDRIHKIYGVYFTPEKEPIGIIQIVHGMCEYFERYEEMIDFFLKEGFIVCGHDHLGHGNSAIEEEYGYFGDDGAMFLVKDTYIFSKNMKKLYPNLPYFIYGHSLGSFITRVAMVKYRKLADKVILSGTGEPKALAFIGDIICYYTDRFKYENKINPIIDNSMRALNILFWIKDKAIGNGAEWLSRDKAVQEAFLEDAKCNFTFKNSAHRDMYKLINISTSEAWYDRFPKEQSLLIVSGTDDPIGENGIGVRRFFRRLLSHGAYNVNLIMYKNARHELHKEINNREVFEDIIKYLNK